MDIAITYPPLPPVMPLFELAVICRIVQDKESLASDASSRGVIGWSIRIWTEVSMGLGGHG